MQRPLNQCFLNWSTAFIYLILYSYYSINGGFLQEMGAVRLNNNTGLTRIPED